MPAAADWQPLRYFAWLYSHPQQRLQLAALFGIEREVSSCLRAGLDHQVAHTRLQWWREECERCAAGQAVHPLTRGLVAAFNGAPVAQLAGLTGLVDAAVWDLASATFERRQELTAYCGRWAAAIVEPVTSQSRAAGMDWGAAGAALRELELLTHLSHEARAGRLRIPLDELEQAGVEPGSLAHPPWPAPLAKLLDERHSALQAALSDTLSQLVGRDQLALRGLLVWMTLAWKSSARAQRALPGCVGPRRAEVITASWDAWRAARQASTGLLRLE